MCVCVCVLHFDRFNKTIQKHSFKFQFFKRNCELANLLLFNFWNFVNIHLSYANSVRSVALFYYCDVSLLLSNRLYIFSSNTRFKKVFWNKECNTKWILEDEEQRNYVRFFLILLPTFKRHFTVAYSRDCSYFGKYLR